MSTERETESCKVFVGFVLPSTGISNPGMTYTDRAMGHCLWMDGWKASRKMTAMSFTICNSHKKRVVNLSGCLCEWRFLYSWVLLSFKNTP
jgi:hypothetical protein